MKNRKITGLLLDLFRAKKLDIAGADAKFYTDLALRMNDIQALYSELYAAHPGYEENFARLIEVLISAHQNRSATLKKRDDRKAEDWFLSNDLAGMSLYVDRFCGKLADLPGKLDYLRDLGVNLVHLMPIFASPAGESDGGYAVSDFRKVDEKFGTIQDLKKVQAALGKKGMYLMLDIVLNHTSHRHAWAEKAKAGDPIYQDYFYFYDFSTIPEQFEQSMPEVFPQAAPGNFTWVPECKKWVMTVFHNYQWDLNYANPRVFAEMLGNVLYFANLGVDILRIDAPAFLWKQIGTNCQNLPQAHTILRLIKKCVEVAAPGMVLLGEAIVAPHAIMKYFGEGRYRAEECDFAYNATQMALQWDALATGQTSVMHTAQPVLAQKPIGTSWITYTRCHDDIGLGYDDAMIRQAGYDPFPHRQYLKEYYSGDFPDSPARGALFSVNEKTQDARISGTLASLCGLEKAVVEDNESGIALAVQRILLMQAHSMFLGGLPMLFYGDEAAYLNDYSYQDDPARSYDNRWMHRPLIDWKKNARTKTSGTIENQVFAGTKRMISLRKKLSVVADTGNITWLSGHNIHVTGFLRHSAAQKLYCLFNYSSETAFLTWYAFKEHGDVPLKLYDHWGQKEYEVGRDEEYLIFPPYSFYLLEVHCYGSCRFDESSVE
ncbi:amylosucrase [Persicitalea sp.]|uniref:amylosucrase n=1 Tax=Persicitalea sp. TaxID=3100273 RepID=UPI0035935CA7